MTSNVFTQAYLDQLELMVVNGVTSMSFGDQSIQFENFDQLVKRIEYVKRALRGEAPGSRLAATSKGV